MLVSATHLSPVAQLLREPERQGTFDELVARFCRFTERQLHRYLKAELPRLGFAVEADDYKAASQGDDERHDIKNIRAVRGAPLVAFAAHSDTCREAEGITAQPTPVEFALEHEDVARRVLQDRDAAVQIGGDDRVGCAILFWLAAHTTGPLALFFFSDEEIGLLGAHAAPASWFENLELLVALDRGNVAAPDIVTEIAGLTLCSNQTATRLQTLAESIGFPRALVKGRRTDVYEIRKRGLVPEVVNLSCGYHDSHGASGAEFIDLDEAFESARFAGAIAEEFFASFEEQISRAVRGR